MFSVIEALQWTVDRQARPWQPSWPTEIGWSIVHDC